MFSTLKIEALEVLLFHLHWLKL